MITIRKFSALMLVVAMLLMLATSVALAQDPANGKIIWEEGAMCKRCHGDSGEGMWAGPLAGTDKTADEWLEQVRSPKKRMPHFSPEKVTDAMVIDMQAYMATLTPPASFSLADAGLAADAPEGQKLIVEKKCIACHGDTGPVNNFIKRGEVPTVEAVIKQLRTPFKNMPMFAPEQVSDAEATLIAEFMAAQVPPPALPVSGGTDPANRAPITLLLLGAGLVLLGLTSKKLIVKL